MNSNKQSSYSAWLVDQLPVLANLFSTWQADDTEGEYAALPSLATKLNL
jgi:hypothetical protein